MVYYFSLLEVTDPKNDLGPFLVTLQQTDNFHFYGPCQIEIQPKKSERVYFVAVYDMNQPPRMVIRWQIDHLRGYGSNESVLKIQTGRLVKYTCIYSVPSFLLIFTCILYVKYANEINWGDCKLMV